MGSFADSIKKNIDKILTQVDQKCYAIATDLFTTVVNKSPTQPFANYAKGQFINNWFTAVNSYSNATTSAFNYDGMNSRNQIASLKDTKAFYGKDGFVSMTNSTPWAYLVEVKGWGRRGPYAPVRNGFIEVVPKYK